MAGIARHTIQPVVVVQVACGVRNDARQAGLDEQLVSPHVLRQRAASTKRSGVYTFATRYLAANPGDLRGLAAILGHRSLDTVMVYTEPNADGLAARIAEAHLADEDVE